VKVCGEQRPEFFDFAARVLEVELRHDAGARVIANLDGDRIAAVTAFTRFDARNAEMSIASDGSKKWMTRAFLYESFAYPFITLNLERVTGVVDSRNRAALTLDLKLGFVPEGVLRRWFGEADGILLGMLRSECRWLQIKDVPKG
jgi:RimJ/RimL family protein N-acetyltransferase